MAFPAPPIRGGEVGPAAQAGLSNRIKAQENPVLPEPRTYYAENLSTVTVNTGASGDLLTMPVFWRPGNQLSVLFLLDHTCSPAGQQGRVDMTGSPFGATLALITSFTAAVFPAASTRATTVAGGVDIDPFKLFQAQYLTYIPYNGLSGLATTPGMFNIVFKMPRTAGAGTMYAHNTRCWITIS